MSDSDMLARAYAMFRSGLISAPALNTLLARLGGGQSDATGALAPAQSAPAQPGPQADDDDPRALENDTSPDAPWFPAIGSDGGGAPVGLGTGMPGAFGGNSGASVQQVEYRIPQTGPDAPDVRPTTGANNVETFADRFDDAQEDGVVVGDQTFGAVTTAKPASKTGNTITSSGIVTAFDGERILGFAPNKPNATVSVTIDPATQIITAIQNFPRRP